MNNKLEKITNYRIFSEHRSFLMGVATAFIGIFHITSVSKAAIHKVPGLYDYMSTFNIGVEMFLFLSGIGLYFAYSKKPKFKDYYIKRVVNIYVTFLIIHLPFALYINFVMENKSVLHFILNELGITYWYEFNDRSRVGWYVILIMMLYLVYPLIFKVLSSCNRTRAIIVTSLSCLLFIIICFALNKYFYDFFFFYEIGFTRMPIFFIGCCIGKLVYEKEKISPLFFFLIFVGIIIKLMYFIILDKKELIYTRLSQCLFSLFVMYLLVLFAEFVRIKFIYNFFVFFGSISLEFYLVHNMLKDVICFLGLTRIRHYCIMLIVSFFISLAFSQLRKYIFKQYSKKRLNAENKALKQRL